MKHFSQMVITAVVLMATTAQADFKSFNKEEYDAVMSAGKTVVVDFHASWCPTCKKQEPVLNEIVRMKGFENVVAFKADYDQEKDLKKTLNVSKQSTIVVFKGGKEIGRSTGSTSKDELKQLIEKGL